MLKRFLQYGKKILIVVSIIFIFLFIIVSVLYSPVIFQEGNPWPQISGIIRLNFGKEEVVKLGTEGNKYLTKSKNGQEVMVEFMKKNNYQFVEQMGAGYIFQSASGEKIVITHRHYTRFYGIWNFPQTMLLIY